MHLTIIQNSNKRIEKVDLNKHNKRSTLKTSRVTVHAVQKTSGNGAQRVRLSWRRAYCKRRCLQSTALVSRPTGGLFYRRMCAFYSLRRLQRDASSSAGPFTEISNTINEKFPVCQTLKFAFCCSLIVKWIPSPEPKDNPSTNQSIHGGLFSVLPSPRVGSSVTESFSICKSN